MFRNFFYLPDRRLRARAVVVATGAHYRQINVQSVPKYSGAGVYFADYIRVGMYEDVLVADLMDRLGGRLRSAPMARILRTTAQY